MKAHYYNRFGKRWNINECIQLQREFELLELSINEIAKRHQRSPCAIMSRLAYEGFADYNVLYSNYYNLDSSMQIIKQSLQDDDDFQDDEVGNDNSSDYHDIEDDEDDENDKKKEDEDEDDNIESK